MKKIIVLVLSLILLMIPVAANAAAPTATISPEYSIDESTGNIYIDASIVNITAEEGLIYVKYDFEYDHKALELVKVTPYYPTAWQELIDKESSGIEDLSNKVSDGLYRWEIFMFEIGKGAKIDNELGLKLEFKPLTTGETKVDIVYHDMITEVVVNGMTENLISVKGNSATVSIDLANPSEPEIDHGSIEVSDDEVIDESSVSDESIPESSDEVTDNNSGFQGNVSLPDVVQNNSAADDKEAVTPMVWILIGVGVLAIATVVIFAVGSKKGKK